MAINIAAWSSIPIGIENGMRMIYVLATSSSIQRAGLSGFAPSGSSDMVSFLQHLLARIDLYFFWMVGLLVIGISAWSGMSRKKSFVVTLLSIVIILLIQSLLGVGLEKLGSLNINTNVFRFLR